MISKEKSKDQLSSEFVVLEYEGLLLIGRRGCLLIAFRRLSGGVGMRVRLTFPITDILIHINRTLLLSDIAGDETGRALGWTLQALVHFRLEVLIGRGADPGCCFILSVVQLRQRKSKHGYGFNFRVGFRSYGDRVIK